MSSQIQINPDVLKIPYGDRRRILDATQGRVDLINLASGNPDLPMPAFIVERLRASLDSGYARYPNYYGLPELRAKLSQYLKTKCQISADPEKGLLITNGVQEGVHIVMRSVLSPGDEVLIPSPHYADHYMNAIACGSKPILVPLNEEKGFIPDYDRIERAVTPKTRAVVFCNPNNPLGVVWPLEVLEGIASLAKTHNLIVLVDEIYRDFVYTDRPPSKPERGLQT